jgi:hypothetical protein
MATFNVDLQRFPLPGASRLYILDCITILGVQLPLARPIEASTELDIEKRKSPGTDYSTYVSHGLDSSPIRISLLLFRDITSGINFDTVNRDNKQEGKDWIAAYETIRERLISRNLSKRNTVTVYHPFLDMEGINEIIFTKRSSMKQQRGMLFTVDLEGFNPKTTRIGGGLSGAAALKFKNATGLKGNAFDLTPEKSKSVDIDKQNASRPAARQLPKNTVGPSQVGRAFPRGQT